MTRLDEFIAQFGEQHPRAAMLEKAIEVIGDCVKPEGETRDFREACWRYPKGHTEGGYAVVSVLGRKITVSRLLLCCFTGKPMDYRHEETGERMEAAHKTPFICRHTDCCNPDHLDWLTSQKNAKRREADRKLRREVAKTVAQGWLPAEASGITI